MATMEALLVASDRELPLPSSHGCAQGKDLWTLITNDIDHEKIHTGQVLEGRYESRITASPMERLIGEWLVEPTYLRIEPERIELMRWSEHGSETQREYARGTPVRARRCTHTPP